MTESKNASAPWVDPDDAPDLSEADLSHAVWHIAGRQVSPEVGQQAMRRAARGRPAGSVKTDTKQAVTVRYSPDVLAAFRAMGAGWQAKMDDALREWLRTHTAA